MNKKMEVLAVIPARGNSKSIYRKNIKEFAGYPLIAYSIAAGKQAESVTRTIVSTDDEEIASISRRYGAETPFMRPAALAEDTTTDLPVFRHAINWLEKNENYCPDLVVQLRPTSPFRPPGMVDEAVRLMVENPEADSVRGVVPSTQNPYKMWLINENKQMVPLIEVEDIPESYNAPRQDLPVAYWQTGHIDVIRISTIMKKNSMSGDAIFPLFIDPLYSVDIDTIMDWGRAEKTLLEGNLNIVSPGKRKRPFPEKVKLLVMDFDGVLTDDQVYVNEEGVEMVAASRADGFGLERLRKMTDIDAVVISKEKNPVVTARCSKLDIPIIQNVVDKEFVLRSYLEDKKLKASEVVYIGNDLNDLPCFPIVGFAAAPLDAADEVKRQADIVLDKKGGKGAVRELADLLIEKFSKKGEKKNR